MCHLGRRLLCEAPWPRKLLEKHRKYQKDKETERLSFSHFQETCKKTRKPLFGLSIKLIKESRTIHGFLVILYFMGGAPNYVGVSEGMLDDAVPPATEARQKVTFMSHCELVHMDMRSAHPRAPGLVQRVSSESMQTASLECTPRVDERRA